ncbi:hypothetical protein [Streptomyces sp. NPDC002122]|uniref:hypothetical protein n=1 Tax=Streptomyces sp. NPDC002122 TaxID=3154407 RepID=UPI003324322A
MSARKAAATVKEAVEIAGRFPRLRSRIDADATEATGNADAPDDTFAYGPRGPPRRPRSTAEARLKAA